MDKTSINIEMFDLTKYYGSSRGIIELDLEIRRGEIFGFLGPNGAGKTTTIRLLLGLIKPSKGEMKIFGKKVRLGAKNCLYNIGYVPGEMSLYNDLTGYQFLSYFLQLRNKWKDENSRKKLSQLTEKFNINYHKKIRNYSKGTKQIIGIIQALMHEPEILIFDEPTSGLDPIMQEIFYTLLMNERNKGNTIFFSSHNLSEVERVCDRIGIIKEGRLVRTEKLEKGNSIVGKKITLTTPLDEIPVNIKKLKGVKKLNHNKNNTEFFYSGKMSDLMQCLASTEFLDFVCEVPSIEDVFLKFYKED